MNAGWPARDWCSFEWGSNTPAQYVLWNNSSSSRRVWRFLTPPPSPLQAFSPLVWFQILTTTGSHITLSIWIIKPIWALVLSKYILWFLNQVSWICPQIRDMLQQSQTIRFLRLKPYRQGENQVEGKGGDPFSPLDLGPYFTSCLTPNFLQYNNIAFYNSKCSILNLFVL